MLEVGLERVPPRGQGLVVAAGVQLARGIGLAVLQRVLVGPDPHAGHDDALVEPVEGDLVQGVHEREVESEAHEARGFQHALGVCGVQVADAGRHLQVDVERREDGQDVEELAQALQNGDPVLVRRAVLPLDAGAGARDGDFVEDPARRDPVQAEQAVQREPVQVDLAALGCQDAERPAGEGVPVAVVEPGIGRAAGADRALDLRAVDGEARRVALAHPPARDERVRRQPVQSVQLAPHPQEPSPRLVDLVHLGQHDGADAQGAVQPRETVVLEHGAGPDASVGQERGLALLGGALGKALQPLVVSVAQGGPHEHQLGAVVAAGPPLGLVCVRLLQVHHLALLGVQAPRPVALGGGAGRRRVDAGVFEPVLEGAHAVHAQQVLARVPPVRRLQEAEVARVRPAVGSARGEPQADALVGEPVLHGQRRLHARPDPRAHALRRAIPVPDALDRRVHAHPAAERPGAGGVLAALTGGIVQAHQAPAAIPGGAGRRGCAPQHREVLAPRGPRAAGRLHLVPRAQIEHGLVVRGIGPRCLRGHVGDRADREARRLVLGALGAQAGPGQLGARVRAGPLGPLRHGWPRVRGEREVLRVLQRDPRAVAHVVGLGHRHPERARAAQAGAPEVAVHQGGVAEQVVLVHELVARLVQGERLREAPVRRLVGLARHRHVVPDREIPLVRPPVQHPVAELAVLVHRALRRPPRGAPLRIAGRVLFLQHLAGERVVEQRVLRVRQRGHAVDPAHRGPPPEQGPGVEPDAPRVPPLQDLLQRDGSHGLRATAGDGPARVVKHPVDAHEAGGRRVDHAARRDAAQAKMRAGHGVLGLGIGERLERAQGDADVQEVQLGPAPLAPALRQLRLGGHPVLELRHVQQLEHPQARELDRVPQAVGERARLLHGLRGGEKLVQKRPQQVLHRGRRAARGEPAPGQRHLAGRGVHVLLGQVRQHPQVPRPQPGAPVPVKVPRGRDQVAGLIEPQPFLVGVGVQKPPVRGKLALRAVPVGREPRQHGGLVLDGVRPVRGASPAEQGAHLLQGVVLRRQDAAPGRATPAAQAALVAHAEHQGVARPAGGEVARGKERLPGLHERAVLHLPLLAPVVELGLRAHLALRGGVPRAVVAKQGAVQERFLGEPGHKLLEAGRVAIVLVARCEAYLAVRVCGQGEEDLLERGVADVPQGRVLLEQGAHGLRLGRVARGGLCRVEEGLLLRALAARPVVGLCLRGGHVLHEPVPGVAALQRQVVQGGHVVLQGPQHGLGADARVRLAQVLGQQGRGQVGRAADGARAAVRAPAPELRGVAPQAGQVLERRSHDGAHVGHVLVRQSAPAGQQLQDQVAHERPAASAAAGVRQGRGRGARRGVHVPLPALVLIPRPEGAAQALLPLAAGGDGPVVHARVRAHEHAVHRLVQHVPLRAEELGVHLGVAGG